MKYVGPAASASGDIVTKDQVSRMAPAYKVAQSGSGPYTLPTTPDGVFLAVFGDGAFIDGDNYSRSGADVTFSLTGGIPITDFTDLVFFYTEAAA